MATYLTSLYHTHMTNKTCKTQLEKQGQNHKWLPPMDPFIWTYQSWLTNKNLTYSISVGPQDVVWRTYLEEWMIVTNGEGKSGKCMLATRLEMMIYIYKYVRQYMLLFDVYIYIYICMHGDWKEIAHFKILIICFL